MAHLSDTLKSYTNTILIYTAGYTTYYANPILILYVQFLKDLFGPKGFLNTTNVFVLGYYCLFDSMLCMFPKTAFTFLSSIYVTSKDFFF